MRVYVFVCEYLCVGNVMFIFTFMGGRKGKEEMKEGRETRKEEEGRKDEGRKDGWMDGK